MGREYGAAASTVFVIYYKLSSYCLLLVTAVAIDVGGTRHYVLCYII